MISQICKVALIVVIAEMAAVESIPDKRFLYGQFFPLPGIVLPGAGVTTTTAAPVPCLAMTTGCLEAGQVCDTTTDPTMPMCTGGTTPGAAMPCHAAGVTCDTAACTAAGTPCSPACALPCP